MEDDVYPFSIYEVILKRDFVRRSARVYIIMRDMYEDENKDFFKFLEEKFGDSLRRIEPSDYVPIKITQTGRPNMKEIEYDYFIRPWIKERVGTTLSHWEKANKRHLKILIDELRATVNEINRAGDLSKYNYEAIMKCIDKFEK